MAQPGGNPYALRTIGFRICSSRLRGTHTTLTPGARTSADKWAWIPKHAPPRTEYFPTFTWSLDARVRRDGSISISLFTPCTDPLHY